MKSLKDLKEEILAGDIKRFYIFYGEDYGLRYHYIKKIQESFDNLEILSECKHYSASSTGTSLFKSKDLYVVHGDENFAKGKQVDIETFINRIKDDTFILDFEQELPTSTLFKEFSDYITYFPIVKNNIAEQFVSSEISLSQSNTETLAYNCNNNYNNILLECDKIRNYAQYKNINEEIAFQELETKGQLLFRYPEFHSYDLMIDILCKNKSEYSYWYNLVRDKFQEEFWIALESIANDFMIAYYIKKFGPMKGSAKAYDAGFYWGRAKQLRELDIKYEAEDLLDKANQVCELDGKIKSGKIDKENLFDYFLCLVI